MKKEEYFEKILNTIYEGIYFVDANKKITFWNKGAERISGFTYEDMINSRCDDNKLNNVDDSGNKLCLTSCPLHKTIKDGVNREASFYLHHKEGHRVPVKVKTTPIVENGKIKGAVEVFVDQSQDFLVNYDTEDLKEIANIDHLTHVPNRKSFEERLDREIVLVSGKSFNLGIVFIDIDNLKNINQTYGHPVGDRILKMVGKSLNSSIMRTDFLARWGGEEFICILSNTSLDVFKIVTERLRMLAEKSSIRISDREVNVTVSIGATFYIPGESASEAIERAKELMHQSKKNGRNRVTLDK